MATVFELYDVTEELRNFLNEPFPQENREKYIETVNELLEKRERLIAEFTGETIEAEAKTAQIIIDWNKEINEKLNSYLKEVKTDINRLKLKKDTSKKYESPYDTQPDGFFIDKKN